MDDDAGQVAVVGEDWPDVDLLRGEQEFIDVDEGNPTGLSPIVPYAMPIGGELPGRDRPVMQRHHAVRDPGLEHHLEVIRAEIVVEVEMAHTDAPMETEPFFEKWRLLTEDCRHRQLMMRPPRQCRVLGA